MGKMKITQNKKIVTTNLETSQPQHLQFQSQL